MLELLLQFLRRDDGATSVEYAIMAGLIACVIAAAVTQFGLGVSGLLQKTADVITSAS
ncbi:Flp family type IVb pilin [Desulfovibrio aerotolerans]|uniref:Flp family type IVb pilin n=1 Tax=Solidesulfovibrio aerotolerans TaxID=295255 RepID=A0A7C9IMG1_9BACT|nr:Flp family type IVb pilin [Solidesulfovibrio aerotolerans]MYL84521.1 Flp family type IVb pilin [Solidesulfovibrio aerotolerans]